MKQTAVEWLFLQMENLITKAKVTDMDNNDFVISKVKLLQQAKEMEKEQIIDAYDEGDNNGADRIYYHSNRYDKSAEQYYKETFKSE